MIDQGEPKTAFMTFGDTVRMEAVDAAGRAPFGVLEQKVVRA
jgi:fumarylacetoacetate (FAA) hydrolase